MIGRDCSAVAPKSGFHRDMLLRCARKDEKVKGGLQVFALIRKVISIAAHVLVSLAFVAGLVSVIYASVTQIQQGLVSDAENGFAQVFSALRQASSQAVSDLSSGKAAGAVSQLVQAGQEVLEGSRPVGSLLPSDLSGAVSDITAAVGGTGGAAGTDAKELYQAWKDDISSPLTRIFGSETITAELIEGVAGGSMTATAALTDLDGTALAAVKSRAENLSATAVAHQISSALPQDVQAQMSRADQACQELCADVLRMGQQISDLKSGNVTAAGQLSATAADASAHISQMQQAMESAESQLGL